jgi:hypothetical protein
VVDVTNNWLLTSTTTGSWRRELLLGFWTFCAFRPASCLSQNGLDETSTVSRTMLSHIPAPAVKLLTSLNLKLTIEYFPVTLRIKLFSHTTYNVYCFSRKVFFARWEITFCTEIKWFVVLPKCYMTQAFTRLRAYCGDMVSLAVSSMGNFENELHQGIYISIVLWVLYILLFVYLHQCCVIIFNYTQLWRESPMGKHVIFLSAYMISGFHREVNENCTLLGHCIASSGNFLPTFRGSLLVPLSWFNHIVF